MDIENELNETNFDNCPISASVAQAVKNAGFQQGVPSGSYTAVIKDAVHSVHDKGYDVFRISMTITAGKHVGHSLTKYYNHKTKKAVEFFRREMDVIGSIVNSRDKLGDLCNALAGRTVIAEVADHPSGNQVIFLKNANTTRTSSGIDPEELWS